jgi:signal transduction histidine kinase/CheY-like chemotaxis protein
MMTPVDSQKGRPPQWMEAALECHSALDETAIVVISPELEVAYVNDVFRRTWCAAPENAHLRSDVDVWRRVMPRLLNGRPFLDTVLQLSRDTERRVSLSLTQRDGAILECHSAPLADRHGGTCGRMWSFRNVTERRRLLEHLRHSQRLESMGTVSSHIAHEVRNVVAPIIANAERAQRELAQDNPAREFLAPILRAGARAVELAQKVVSFGSRPSLNLRAQDLGSVVQACVPFLQAALPREVRLVLECDPYVPSVLADSGQLEHVLLNLCINAWQAVGRQPLHIGLRVVPAPLPATNGKPAPNTPRHVRLSVSDNGRGMDAETRRRLFEPFFTTRPGGVGSGLGLTIVQEIVHAHGGVISVDSELGVGTTVHIDFPVAQPHAAAGAPQGAADGEARRLLVCDDDIGLLELAIEMLGRLGHNVSGFTDPGAALAAVEMERFDAVICDVSMPAMSGFDFTRRVLRARPDARVVLMSGCVRSSDEDQARNVGAAAIVSKPISTLEFANLVARCLERGVLATPLRRKSVG